MVWQGEDRLIDLPKPRLFGAHQIDNAATAIAACLAFADRTGLAVSDDALAQGITVRRLARANAAPDGWTAVRVRPTGADIWMMGGTTRRRGWPWRTRWQNWRYVTRDPFT